MQARVFGERQNETRNVRRTDAKMVESERINLLADPLLRDVIDFD